MKKEVSRVVLTRWVQRVTTCTKWKKLVRSLGSCHRTPVRVTDRVSSRGGGFRLVWYYGTKKGFVVKREEKFDQLRKTKETGLGRDNIT